MRRLLRVLTLVGLLNLGGTAALADDPTITAQPEVRPDPQGTTAGGSASAAGGTVGPATVATSEPITASSSTTAVPGESSQGSTSALGELPFTATDSAGVGLFGAALTFIGVLLLRRRTQS
jgi:hypothetical protein